MPVIYYLCRNSQLEHPHLMEVPLSSPHGLYLRDVISRLDALRGKGMAASYSWSCKRSYKNAFVWHDLSEDDLLLPAQGTEYIIKGSQLLPDHSPPPPPSPPVSVHQHTYTSANHAKVQSPELADQQDDDESPRSPPPPPAVAVEDPEPQAAAALPLMPSPTIGDEEEQCRTGSCSDDSSPKTTRGSLSDSSGSGSGSSSGSGSGSPTPRLTPYSKVKVCSPAAAQQEQDHHADAGAQTKDNQGQDASESMQQEASPRAKRSEGEIVQAPAGAGAETAAEELCAGGGSERSRTLESLIREEASRRGLEEEEERSPVGIGIGKLHSPGSLLMRLIACGSMSVKNYHPGLGLLHAYNRPPPQQQQQFTELEFPASPPLSPIRSLQQHDYSPGIVRANSESSTGGGRSSSDTGAGDEAAAMLLRRSTSYNHHHQHQHQHQPRVSKQGGEEECSLRTRKMAAPPCGEQQTTPTRSSGSTTLVSITTDVKGQKLEAITATPSARARARSVRSSRVVSFHDDKDKVIKIQERLASGARVIIQSQCAPLP